MEHLMRGNLLALEVQEMIEEVQLKKKTSAMKALDEYLDSVKTILSEKTAKYVGKSITDKWTTKNIPQDPWPFVNYTDTLPSLNFDSPESMEVIGSHPMRTSTSPYFNVDLSICMNSKCFDER